MDVTSVLLFLWYKMLPGTETIATQVVNTTVNVAMLVAIVKATRSITRLEMKVEMMWKIFARNIGMPEFKE